MVSLLLAIIYLAFISLGLPDSLLGAAWPTMYAELNVPVSFAGIISMIISIGTVISSLFCAAITKHLGSGKITVISTALTAAALLGFSFSGQFWALCLWSIPYGLGAGCVDAVLNNYVALHYSSRHMSWLHCMWGVGTVIGPYVMSYALTGGLGWGMGYRLISFLQAAVAVILILSLPLWKKSFAEKRELSEYDEKSTKTVSLSQVFKIRGAIEVMITFFCYCAVEQTAMLWASSYMHLHHGVSEENAAALASILFIGITLGRLINGFLTSKFNDKQMVRVGEALIIAGTLLVFLPLGKSASVIGFLLIGLGCAPIYPCIIHSTPEYFGKERSQAMIGIQMASAYLGTCLMPTLFGLIANHINVALLPIYLFAITAIMILTHELLTKKARKS